MTDQNKTHGVLSDAEINELVGFAQHNTTMRAENDRKLAREVEAAVLAKAAPQSPVAPLRCEGCGKTMAEHDRMARCHAPVAPADERAAFEAAFHRFDLRPSIRAAHYADLRTEFMWEAWEYRARLSDAPRVSATVPVAWQAARFEGQWHWIGEANVQTYREAGYMVRELYAAPTPTASADDAFKQAEITERGDFHLTLRFPSCRLVGVAAAAIADRKESGDE